MIAIVTYDYDGTEDDPGAKPAKLYINSPEPMISSSAESIQGFADAPHFVFEQLAQRLDQLQLHALGQAAHVVVALDDRAGAFDADALDHVRVQRALYEELRVFYAGGVGVEDVDEHATDGLALLFRVRNAAQLVQELLPGVDRDQVEVKVLAHHGRHALELTFA